MGRIALAVAYVAAAHGRLLLTSQDHQRSNATGEGSDVGEAGQLFSQHSNFSSAPGIHGYAMVLASMQQPYSQPVETYRGWMSLNKVSTDARMVNEILSGLGLVTEMLISYSQTKEMRLNPRMDRPMVTKHTVLEKLYAMFLAGREHPKPLFFFYYTGHGENGYNKPDVKGALVLQRDLTSTERLEVGDYGTAEDFLTFREILQVWKSAQKVISGKAKFVLMADSCYSGKLAKQLRDLCTSTREGCPNLNMAVQSAGDAFQSVLEAPHVHGGRPWMNGELTGWWLARNWKRALDTGVRWSGTAGHPSYPTYFASWGPGNRVEGPTLDLKGYVEGEGLWFMVRKRPSAA